jgi:hypothetical protein
MLHNAVFYATPAETAAGNFPWLNKKAMPVGTVCLAKCLGVDADEENVDELRVLGLVADFTCGEDGTWQGELVCPSSEQTPEPAETARSFDETPWRAESNPAIQPRWALTAAYVSGDDISVTPHHECKWVDTHSATGRYLWLAFSSDLDREDLPDIEAFETIFTGSNSDISREVQYLSLEPIVDPVQTVDGRVHLDFGREVSISKIELTKNFERGTVIIANDLFGDAVVWEKAVDILSDDQGEAKHVVYVFSGDPTGKSAQGRLSDAGSLGFGTIVPKDFCYPVLLKDGHFFRTFPIAFAMAGGLQRASKSKYCGMNG